MVRGPQFEKRCHRLLMEKSIIHIKPEIHIIWPAECRNCTVTTAVLPHPTSYFSSLNVVLTARLCLGLPKYFLPLTFLTTTLCLLLVRDCDLPHPTPLLSYVTEEKPETIYD